MYKLGKIGEIDFVFISSTIEICRLLTIQERKKEKGRTVFLKGSPPARVGVFYRGAGQKAEKDWLSSRPEKHALKNQPFKKRE